MSQRKGKPVHTPVQSPAQDGAAPASIFHQVNQVFLPQESLPDPQKLAQIRAAAPEFYEQFLDEAKRNGEHNRMMQSRAMTLDEAQIPRVISNDRLGLVLSTVVVLVIVGAGVFLSVKGYAAGPFIALAAALPPLAAALAKWRGK